MTWRAVWPALLLLFPIAARAADPKPGPPIAIHRVAGPIKLDGDLSDPGWKGCEPITQWFETRVGDNVEPQVKNVAYLAYDDHYLYAGFQFDDPNPKLIRAPIGEPEVFDHEDDEQHLHAVIAEPLPHLDQEEDRERAGSGGL